MRKPTWRPVMLTACLVVAAFMPAAAAAQQLHYTYIEGGYTDVDPDDDLLDSGDGWFFGGSFRLKSFHLFAEYSDRSVEGLSPGTDLDQTRAIVGGGWHGLFGPSVDLVVDAAYVNSDVRFNDTDLGDSGYLGQVGLRWMLIPYLEVDGYYRYIDLFDEAESLYKLNGIVWIKQFGIGVSLEKADAADLYNFFLRINFGG